MLIRLRLILKFLFYFFGTFLHEIAHYIAALIMGKAEGFSMLPKVEGGSFIFGSVKYRVRYKVFSCFVACAPLLWWLVLVLMLLNFRLILNNNEIPGIHYSLIMRRLKSFSLKDAFFIWLFIQLLWAGRLSSKDIKNFFAGIFSISGIVLLSATAGVIYFLAHFL